MNRILSRALALVHTVIEYASIDGGRIIVGVRPWTSFGLRCPVCGRAANATVDVHLKVVRIVTEN